MQSITTKGQPYQTYNMSGAGKSQAQSREDYSNDSQHQDEGLENFQIAQQVNQNIQGKQKKNQIDQLSVQGESEDEDLKQLKIQVERQKMQLLDLHNRFYNQLYNQFQSQVTHWQPMRYSPMPQWLMPSQLCSSWLMGSLCGLMTMSLFF